MPARVASHFARHAAGDRWAAVAGIGLQGRKVGHCAHEWVWHPSCTSAPGTFLPRNLHRAFPAPAHHLTHPCAPRPHRLQLRLFLRRGRPRCLTLCCSVPDPPLAGSLMITTPQGAERHYTLSYSDFCRHLESEPSFVAWFVQVGACTAHMATPADVRSLPVWLHRRTCKHQGGACCPLLPADRSRCAGADDRPALGGRAAV